VLWLLTSLLKVVFRLKVIALSVAAGVAIAYGLMLREQSRSWGLLRGDADRPLPGDDLVADPDHTETRSLIVEAPAAAVWPWLVQMGYERGGWYGLSQLDRAWSPVASVTSRSADRIMPEFGDLAAGDIVPTHPGGGFVAKVVEPGKALVLYLDDAIVRDQAQAAADEGSAKAAERLRDMDMPAFRLSWAFVLEGEPAGRSRLIERFRLQMDLSAPQRRGLPIMGLGVFALMRSQMLGIKRRVERGGQAAA
jgi:hypothetical protein